MYTDTGYSFQRTTPDFSHLLTRARIIVMRMTAGQREVLCSGTVFFAEIDDQDVLRVQTAERKKPLLFWLRPEMFGGYRVVKTDPDEVVLDSEGLRVHFYLYYDLCCDSGKKIAWC